jgi:hypothetical protein
VQAAAAEPTTITVASPKGKIKEPTSTCGKNTRPLASALSAFNMQALSPGILSPAFSPVPSLPLSVEWDDRMSMVQSRSLARTMRECNDICPHLSVSTTCYGKCT